jgi:hypothetical protein
MNPNADITAYLKDVNPVTRDEVYVRVQVRCVTWEERKAANVIKSGLMEADRVTVYIPLDRAINLKAGDVLVRGLVTDEISAGFTPTALLKKYPDHATVRSVDKMDRGSLALRHWEIGAT